MNNKIKAKTTREDFENWIFDMSDTLERFIAQFPLETQKQLDFSPNSLNILENWFLSVYPNIQSMCASDQSNQVNGIACYIGETFRKTIGGKWDINLDDPKMAFFGLPILTGSPKLRAPICPHTLATASADRRTGTYLGKIMENLLNR